MEKDCICGGHDFVEPARIHYFKEKDGRWMFEIYVDSDLFDEGEIKFKSWIKVLNEKVAQ